MQHHRVIVVGAGPIGIELAVVLKRMGVDTLHLEAGAVGQTITWYPKQARFFSSPDRIAIAGVPLITPDQSKASREAYLAYLRGVVQQFQLDIHTHEPVRRIEHDEAAGTFTVKTPKRTATCDHLVLAIGDMHLPRELGIEGEDLPHVSHYFDEPHAYFGRNLLIVGGRNSAAEAALRCHRVGAHVAMSYRGDSFDDNGIKYWLLPELKSLIKHGEIAFHPHTIPTKITDTQVELTKKGTLPILVDADHVLLLTGYTQDKTLFEMAGVELTGDNRAPTFDAETMQTNVPNLYIAGTAAAGTQQRYRLFIENCHEHATRIAKAITGQTPPSGLINETAKTYGLAES
ncbi:MAG: NAD(P)-binding domain-containing protein [Phycisphaeraceae bacterium]